MRAGIKTKLKTAKGRKISSTKWLERQINDPYVKQSKTDGYRSRAAYKLIQINEKFKLLNPGDFVIDLGAAPGGWTQVVAEAIRLGNNKNSRLIALDLQEMEPLPVVEFIYGDFTSEEVYNELNEKMGNIKPNLIISDMAPSACGNSQVDHDRIMLLCEIVFDFAFTWLKKGGSLVVKVLRGGTEGELLKKIKKFFTEVRHFKPAASRADSSEIYLVAIGYKGNVSE